MLEVAALADAVVLREQPHVVRAEHGLELARRPGVEAALFPFAVRILGRVERAVRRGQVARDILEHTACGLGPACFAGRAVARPGRRRRAALGRRASSRSGGCATRDRWRSDGTRRRDDRAGHSRASPRAARAPCGVRSRHRPHCGPSAPSGRSGCRAKGIWEHCRTRRRRHRAGVRGTPRTLRPRPRSAARSPLAADIVSSNISTWPPVASTSLRCSRHARASCGSSCNRPARPMVVVGGK